MKQSDQQLSEIPDLNPGPVCRLDLAGRVLFANRAAHALFQEVSVVGALWTSLCPGMTGRLWSMIAGGSSPVSHEADFGGMCVLFTHVRHPSGDSMFVFGADVTELRVAERKLASQAALLAEQASHLAELARFPEMNPGPVLCLDLQGTILQANTGARRIFGENTHGAMWQQLCPEVSTTVWQEILGATDPFQHEAVVDGCSYVFTHRRDPDGDFVFVFGADVTRQKLAERAMRQTEKMATLGTLAAGVAHELNNPAAAARRSANYLAQALPRFEEALFNLDLPHLNDNCRAVVRSLDERARHRAIEPIPLDPLARSDMESEVEEWLTRRGTPDAVDLASGLVSLGLTPGELPNLETDLGDGSVLPVLTWAARAFSVYQLLHEIGQASKRVSEIVTALKGYSSVGQAPRKMVDIHEGIENTLVILRSKLVGGISVSCDYDRTIPLVCALPGELNQVWTNLVANAAEAVNGSGNIVIRTSRQGNLAVVAIEDDGPGIPEKIRSRIFDPFFTTKEPGKGTGLGLSTTYSIVKDLHKGDIELKSTPGRTVFTVRLLIDNPHLAGDK